MFADICTDTYIYYIYTQLHSGPTGENPVRGIACGRTEEPNLIDSPVRGGEHSTAEDMQLANEPSVAGAATPPATPQSHPSSVLQTCNTG